MSFCGGVCMLAAIRPTCAVFAQDVLPPPPRPFVDHVQLREADS